jgi:hypothetical protein
LLLFAFYVFVIMGFAFYRIFNGNLKLAAILAVGDACGLASISWSKNSDLSDYLERFSLGLMPARIIWPEQIDSARLVSQALAAAQRAGSGGGFCLGCDRQVARFCSESPASAPQPGRRSLGMAADWDSGAARLYLVSLREDPDG